MPVDLIHSVLRAGEREWPVSLDLSTGALAVHLPSRTYAVRSLTWGEKRTLARFAFLGETFLERQLAATCASPHFVSDDADEAHALAMAAAWMTAPEGDHLPLSSASLLRAADEIERCTGMLVGDLNSQPAADVESLWRSLSGEMRAGQPQLHTVSPPSPPAPVQARPAGVLSHPHATTPLPAGWQRILVVPAGTEPAAAAEQEKTTAAQDQAAPDHHTEPEPEPIAARNDETPPSTKSPQFSDASPQRLREAPGRFRLVYASSQPTRVSPSNVVTAQNRPAAASGAASTSFYQGDAPMLPAPREFTAPMRTGLDREPFVHRPFATSSREEHPPADFPGPQGSPDLLDTLAHELEEAAAAVGIDFEG